MVLLCPAVIMFIHHYQFYSVAIIVIIIIIIIIIIFAEVTTMNGVDRIKCFFVIGTRMFLNKVPKRKAKKESQYCDYKPSCFTYIISAVCNKNQLYGL